MAPARGTVPESGASHPLLALQQAAGNRAVAGLVQRRAEPSSADQAAHLFATGIAAQWRTFHPGSAPKPLIGAEQGWWDADVLALEYDLWTVFDLQSKRRQRKGSAEQRQQLAAAEDQDAFDRWRSVRVRLRSAAERAGKVDPKAKAALVALVGRLDDELVVEHADTQVDFQSRHQDVGDPALAMAEEAMRQLAPVMGKLQKVAEQAPDVQQKVLETTGKSFEMNSAWLQAGRVQSGMASVATLLGIFTDSSSVKEKVAAARKAGVEGIVGAVDLVNLGLSLTKGAIEVYGKVADLIKGVDAASASVLGAMRDTLKNGVKAEVFKPIAAIGELFGKIAGWASVVSNLAQLGMAIAKGDFKAGVQAATGVASAALGLVGAGGAGVAIVFWTEIVIEISKVGALIRAMRAQKVREVAERMVGHALAAGELGRKAAAAHQRKEQHEGAHNDLDAKAANAFDAQTEHWMAQLLPALRRVLNDLEQPELVPYLVGRSNAAVGSTEDDFVGEDVRALLGQVRMGLALDDPKGIYPPFITDTCRLLFQAVNRVARSAYGDERAAKER